MKIIDLLVNIANGEETPDRFIYDGKLFEKYLNNYYEHRDYGKKYGYIIQFTDEILSDYSNLNDEIEIVDTPKTLEDILTPDELKCFEDVKELVTRLSDGDVKIMLRLLLGDEYDELMDKIRGEQYESR